MLHTLLFLIRNTFVGQHLTIINRNSEKQKKKNSHHSAYLNARKGNQETSKMKYKVYLYRVPFYFRLSFTTVNAIRKQSN